MSKVRAVPPNRNNILRFPSGIKDDEQGQKLLMGFKMCFQAFDPEFVDDSEIENRVRCKISMVELAGVLKDFVGGWIVDLIANPQANRPKPEIPTDSNHYSMSICADGVVYSGLVPTSNIEDDEGYITFVYKGKLQT